MRNSTLIVGSLTDGVTSDGRAILEALGSARAAASKFDVGGLLHATQSSEGRFFAELPRGITVSVKRITLRSDGKRMVRNSLGRLGWCCLVQQRIDCHRGETAEVYLRCDGPP
jgi:hypothetical protein